MPQYRGGPGSLYGVRFLRIATRQNLCNKKHLTFDFARNIVGGNSNTYDYLGALTATLVPFLLKIGYRILTMCGVQRGGLCVRTHTDRPRLHNAKGYTNKGVSSGPTSAAGLPPPRVRGRAKAATNSTAAVVTVSGCCRAQFQARSRESRMASLLMASLTIIPPSISIGHSNRSIRVAIALNGEILHLNEPPNPSRMPHLAALATLMLRNLRPAGALPTMLTTSSVAKWRERTMPEFGASWAPAPCEEALCAA
jgi:hypothetical protein